MFACAIGGQWARGVDLWGVEIGATRTYEGIRTTSR